MPLANHKLCGAKLKTREGTCTQPAMPNGRCKMHNGKAKSGIASPRFKHGRYSAVLPARMQDNFLEHLADPNLIAADEDMAILKARRNDLLTRVDTGESGELWRSVRQTWLEGEKALPIWNAGGETIAGREAKATFFQVWETLGILTSEGVQDYQAWDEVKDAIEAKRKLSESEVKRFSAAHKAITADKAMVLIAAIQSSILRHVKDRAALSAIAADLATLSNVPGVGAGA